MPSDVTGSSIYNQRDADFEFRPGPIFANLLLADEINRAPPKTQAALLEAMQERQVTADGRTHPLERPFLVLATQNPIEYEGTYPLPEAQLDRFLLRDRSATRRRTTSGGCSSAHRAARATIELDRRSIDRETLLEMQAAVEHVHVDPSRSAAYIVDLVAATRDESASLASVPARAARSRCSSSRAAAAALAGPRLRHPRRREGDRRACARAPAACSSPSSGCSGERGEDVVRELLETVPVPPAEDVRPAS